MAYDNIPGVVAEITDGSFRTIRTSSQPRILLLGTATSGLTNETYSVTSIRSVERDYGKTSEITKGLFELYAQRADNVGLMRIGGRESKIIFKDAAGGSITVVPNYRDDEILERYALIVSNDGVANRYLIYDIRDERWVYDTLEIYAINTELIDIEDDGLALSNTTATASGSTSLFVALSSVAVSDFGSGVTAIAKYDGDDGVSMTLCERYAALNSAYAGLDDNDADYVTPLGIFADSKNIADDGAVWTEGLYFNSFEVVDGPDDQLGYVWQYIYRGKLYTYFVESKTLFADLVVTPFVKAAVTAGGLTVTAVKPGLGGNDIQIAFVQDSDPASITVTGSSAGMLITLSGDIATGISDDDAAELINEHPVASQWVVAASPTVGDISAIAATSLIGGNGPVAGGFVTHRQLTGDKEPAAVLARFLAGKDLEVREVSFLNQLGDFCHRASTSWKSMLGTLSTKGPSGFSRAKIADWIGDLPTYTDIGLESGIASSADNGAGLLGLKLIAGHSAYRNAMFSDPDNNQNGFIYGGIIKTKGVDLPNGNKNIPGFNSYGVLDTDELLDSNSQPVDLGKHLWVTYSWPVHSNGFDGGTTYRGPINVSVLGLLTQIPAYEEPIGERGRLPGVYLEPRIHNTQKDSLALLRMSGLQDMGGGALGLINAKTAAHPMSDYTALATMRSVNVIMNGVRSVARRYVGRPFNTNIIMTLQSDIDQFLSAMGKSDAPYHSGASFELSYSEEDRIMGRLTVKVKMVPTSTLKTITVEMTLSRDGGDA